ncbi:MAG: ABC transporter ATP-binding protein [Oscillospiraceae bacterium]|nr:ABC transporter ATP-binding protein [Oscillospiraceae bacterium]
MKERTVIFWILKRVRHRLPMLAAMILFNAASALLGVLFALGTKGVIDSAVAGVDGDFLAACAIQLAIICGVLLCSNLAHYLRDRLVTELDRDWKRTLLHGLLNADYAQVSGFHSGELVNRLNNDVRVLNSGLVSAVPELVSMVVRLVTAVTVLAAVQPKFTLALALMGGLVVFATSFARRWLKNINKQVSRIEGRVLSFLQEALERLLVVQAMDLSTEVERRADELLTERRRIHRKRRKVSLLANSSVSGMFYLAGFVTLVWCAFNLLHGRMTFGTLTAVTQLVSQLQTPFIHLSGFIPQYAAMTAAAERLMELEQIKEEPALEERNWHEYYERMESIGAQGLCFGYDGEEVLHEVSFSLPKGVFAAITGASGIGKSTLLKLMLGVFHPEKGTLYVQHGGEQIPLSRNTRGLFAYVPQGNFLFSGTLKDNILISNPEAGEKQLQQAVHISAMDQFLPQLPDGLDTVIGENGHGLSEGQVQRLAIARAVLSGAPVLLLDEATSALDAQTERLVLERIAGLPGRTCIAVTHRSAALELADWRLEVADKTITAHPMEK